MRKFVIILCASLFLTNSLLGIGAFDKAPGLISTAKEQITDYMRSNNDSLLKSYNAKTGKWENWSGSDKNVYIISHGLNDQHDAKWINETAAAMKLADPNAVILTVNWDQFSGTSDDKNFLASTWIGGVSELLSEALQGVNIEQAVGHSYGAHLLANVISKYSGNVNSFVALDPAEERGTLVTASSIWDTAKLESFWIKATQKTHVEVYKSSVLYGTEIPLGDENYLLAAPGKIDPLSVGGDWNGGAENNHSLATIWYAEMAQKKAKEVQTGVISIDEAFSGWFSDDVKAGVTTTDSAGNTINEAGATGQGTWTGVVNTQKGDTLEYLLPASKATSVWANVFTLMGMSIQDWNGTVLNPNHKAKFDEIDKEELFKKQSFVDGDGNTWEVDPLTGWTYKNGQKVRNDFDFGKDWETSPDPSSLESLSEVLENIMEDAEKAGKDTLEDALDIFKDTWKNTTGSIWDKLKASIGKGVEGGINSLKGNIKILINKYITWNQLENLVNYGLNKFLEKHPVLQKILNKLGLDNISNIIGFCKDIFNLVRGLLNGQSFLTLLQNSYFIRNVIANLLQWGLDLVKNFLASWTTKFFNNQWINNFANRVLGAFNLNQIINFQNLLNSGIGVALKNGTQWIQNNVIDKVRPAPKQQPAGGERIDIPTPI